MQNRKPFPDEKILFPLLNNLNGAYFAQPCEHPVEDSSASCAVKKQISAVSLRGLSQE